MMNSAVAVLLALAAGAQTPAATGAASAAASQSAPRMERPAQNNDAQRICVRDQLTGSILPVTVCRTRSEWNRAGGLPGGASR